MLRDCREQKAICPSPSLRLPAVPGRPLLTTWGVRAAWSSPAPGVITGEAWTQIVLPDKAKYATGTLVGQSMQYTVTRWKGLHWFCCIYCSASEILKWLQGSFSLTDYHPANTTKWISPSLPLPNAHLPGKNLSFCQGCFMDMVNYWLLIWITLDLKIKSKFHYPVGKKESHQGFPDALSK